MELTQDQVIDILKLIDQSPMGRVSLQIGDLKLEVVKGDGRAVPSEPRPQIVDSVASPAPAAPLAPAEIAPLAANDETTAEEGLVAINAPILGIFYRRPDPGSPPYVEEGSLVDADTIVALIEVMKLFNPVKAGLRGRIRKACVANGQAVEYGQPLFLVLPE